VIRAVEELAMNAWPSLQTMLYDGWVLRFSDGYTKRANSVHPLYSSSLDVEEKVQACEEIYQNKGLDIVFKMTASAQPDNLEQVLAAKGYKADSRTSVQVAELGGVDQAPAQTALLTEDLHEWLPAYCKLSHISGRRELTLAQLLHNIVPALYLASIRHQGQVVACGMGVLQGQFVGLFDIVTDAYFRRQGFGKQLVLNILAWGKRNGAHMAYLQVMLNNEPALCLYSGLGFKEIYTYWYRIKHQAALA
jgi:ribosomal protein S18 acetylase RimI-like enzyme